MRLKLRDYQLKMDCYILRMLSINLFVTTNQIPIIDAQKIKRMEYKHNTLRKGTKSPGRRAREEKKKWRTMKTTRKKLTIRQ